MHNGHLTFKQYKITDIFFLTALFTILESVVTLAANKWFPGQPYAFSLSVLFIALFLMRWGLFAFIPAIAGAVAFCIASDAGSKHYFIYIIGNLTSLLSYLYIRYRGKETVRKDPVRMGLFVILIFLFMQIGRTVTSLFFDGKLTDIILFLTTDSLSLLFALIAALALRKADGLFEDQKAFLFRMERERNENRRR